MTSIRALVVDDSPAMRRSLVYALRRMATGVVCTEAEDGADAWKKLSEATFDLVVTDINMPMMDGLKLIGLIRQTPACQHLPIVVITTSTEDRQRAVAMGANAYLTKPIQSRVVVDTIRALLKLE